MAFYYQWAEKSKYPYANMAVYTKKGNWPMNDKTWSAIEAYYLNNSPNQIPTRTPVEIPLQEQFEEISLDKICDFPAITALYSDLNGQLITACNNKIVAINEGLEQTTLFSGQSVITQIERKSASELYILDAGQLGPHNQPRGALLSVDQSTGETRTLVRDLYRPVYLNRSGHQIFISEYGNDIGQLSVYNEQKDSLSPIVQQPGSFRSYLVDTDQNGQMEWLVQFSQAREGIYRLTKEKDQTFVSEPVITFPPSFGLSDLDTADINGDGFVDLVIANGDNADFSNIPKSYHGVRIFLNDQKGNFSESYFFPLYGATQVRCLDANGNRKTDIIVAAFFPNDLTESLLLLKNQSDASLRFEARKFENASSGRWMVMTDGDIDQDGDTDVVLGSFISGPTHLEGAILDKWLKESVDLLILRNKLL